MNGEKKICQDRAFFMHLKYLNIINGQYQSKTKGKKIHKQTGLKRVQKGNYADSSFNLKMDRFEPVK